MEGKNKGESVILTIFFSYVLKLTWHTVFIAMSMVWKELKMQAVAQVINKC